MNSEFIIRADLGREVVVVMYGVLFDIFNNNFMIKVISMSYYGSGIAATKLDQKC